MQTVGQTSHHALLHLCIIIESTRTNLRSRMQELKYAVAVFTLRDFPMLISVTKMPPFFSLINRFV